jgi:carboxymethylenebutenolidase
MSISGTDLQLQVNGKSARAYLAQPAEAGPGVLVLHAWWGLKPFFKQVCDRLAEDGFTALAPDLYQGRIAATIGEAEELLAKRDHEFMQAAVKMAKAELAARLSGKLGVLGFSMGASWALDVAEQEPDVAAVVLYYGAGGEDFGRIRARVLGHFAEVDEWEPLDGVRAMEAGMKSAGLDVSFHIYPGCSHWFVEEDRPEYDPAAAQLAWERTLDFLQGALK